MDAAGPLSRTVEDSARVLGVIAGRDDGDPTTSRQPVPDYVAALRRDVRGLRLGVIAELTASADPEVRAAVDAAGSLLAALGATVDAASLPLLPMAGAVFMAVADAEGAGLHRPWLRDRAAQYDRGTRRRLLPAALLRAQMREALERHDVLLAPMAAPSASGRAPITSREDAARRFFTRRSYGSPASLSGTPALSLPCGFTGSGLPIGLQLIGRAFDEATMLGVAHAYEQATDWHRRRPLVA